MRDVLPGGVFAPQDSALFVCVEIRPTGLVGKRRLRGVLRAVPVL